MQYVLLQKHATSHRWLILHRPAPGRASLKVSGACQTSYDWAPLESYDFNFKQNRTAPGRCHFTLNDPTKRRTGAVEFKVVPKRHRAPNDV